MVVDLFNSEVTVAAYSYHTLKNITATIPAGKTLKIETFPDGEELGSGEVPVGKECEVEISVVVRMRDA